jgi:Putative auto-transporter adhesin, head GIN domain
MKHLILALAILTMGFLVKAQHGPLEGSGKVLNKTFDLKDFEQVVLMDLDGKAEIQIGNNFSISVDIDDNLIKLLSVKVNNKVLKIALEGNRNNRMYIENTNIRVKITMPKIAFIKDAGNNNLSVTGITGDYLKVKCTGNASITLAGNIEKLDVVCTGNGNVFAGKLIAKTIESRRRGNGNIYTNAEKESSPAAEGKKQADSKMTKVFIKNNTGFKISLSVKYPVRGSYGIGINAGDSLLESFPAGTKLYRGSQITLFKKPVYTVADSSGLQVFIIKE